MKLYTNNTEVYYNRIGGKREPVVFIHGLGCTRDMWFRQHNLSKDFDLIIPDLRGHGESESLDNISIATFADDIISLLNNLEVKDAHFCGLSMGGAVAQEIYRKYPNRVKSLILCNSFYYIPRGLSAFFNLINTTKSDFLTEKQKKEYSARTSFFSWTQELFNEHKFYYNPKPSVYKISSESCMRVDNRDMLPKINVPTLVIGSQYDSVLPVGIQIEMSNVIPKSDLVIFKNAGHVPNVEKSKVFNATIEEFIKKEVITC